MPEAIPSHTPSRRAAMLGGGGLLAAAVLTGKTSAAAPDADAELIAVCDRYVAMEREIIWKYGDEDIASDEPFIFERSGIIDRICALKATTMAGHTARVRVMQICCPGVFQIDDPLSEEQCMVAALVRDLAPEAPPSLRLAGVEMRS